MLLACCNFLVAISHPIKYKNEITDVCTKLNLNPALVASVINVESKYKPYAKSQRNALGLMQIKLETANYLVDYYKLNLNLEESDLYNPNTNIKLGSLYLNYLMLKFNDVNTALASYNAGETRVRTWLKNPEYSDDGISLKIIPFKETKNYIKKVNNNYKFYKKYYK